MFFDAKWSEISSGPWNEEYILNSGWNYSTSTAHSTQFFLKHVILLSRDDLSGTFYRDNAKQKTTQRKDEEEDLGRRKRKLG